MSSSRLLDPRRFVAIVANMLRVAPLGLGVPLLVGSQVEHGFGILTMLLLIAPSIGSAVRSLADWGSRPARPPVM